MPQVCYTSNSTHTAVEQKPESTLGRKLINKLSLEKDLFIREQTQRREYLLTLTRERDLGRCLNRNSPDHCLLCLEEKQPHLGEQKGRKKEHDCTAPGPAAIPAAVWEAENQEAAGDQRKSKTGTITTVNWTSMQRRQGTRDQQRTTGLGAPALP